MVIKHLHLVNLEYLVTSSVIRIVFCKVNWHDTKDHKDKSCWKHYKTHTGSQAACKPYDKEICTVKKECWTSEGMSKRDKGNAVCLHCLSLQTHIFLQSDCQGTLCMVWSLTQLLSRDNFSAPLHLLNVSFNFPHSFPRHFLPNLRDIYSISTSWRPCLHICLQQPL